MDLLLSETGKAHTDGAHFGEGEEEMRNSVWDMLDLICLSDKTASDNVEAIWSSGQRWWWQTEAQASVAEGGLMAPIKAVTKAWARLELGCLVRPTSQVQFCVQCSETLIFSFFLGSPFKMGAASLALAHSGCQRSWNTGSLAAREETWDHVSAVPIPDSHPVAEAVAGPGGGVRVKGIGSEEAHFGWG